MQHYYYLLIEKIQIYSKTYTAVEQKLNDFWSLIKTPN
jgi:hypothetical protein